jgi:hypothetical protein
MKHLKSNVSDLRSLFEQSISVQCIAESLASFDADASVNRALQVMNERDFDIIGVRDNGHIVGYINRKENLSGVLRDHLVPFDNKHLIDSAAPLPKVFSALMETPRVFLIVLGEVGGIVTRGDLQKSPIRMWLFSLISLIEMQLLRIIRELFPDESWTTEIAGKRLDKAKELYAERERRNENIDLAECLQLPDKSDIVLKSKEFTNSLMNDSKRSIRKLIKRLQKLRDRLAHAQDIRGDDWKDTISLAEKAEAFLIAIEDFKVTPKAV